MYLYLYVMSSEIEGVFSSLLVNKVPVAWASISYASLRPLATWMHDLGLRVAFIRAWLRTGEPGRFTLPHFFSPEAFLTAVLQRHSRQSFLPIDSLTFTFHLRTGLDDEEWMDEPPNEGALVEGLTLSGAGFDMKRKRLKPAAIREPEAMLPVLHLRPSDQKFCDVGEFGCPVYKTASRGRKEGGGGFVLAVGLPSSEPPSVWVEMGVVLLLES